MNNKVVLIGCGNVGMAYAYSLVNQKTYVNELVLIDIDKEKAEGEAIDLNHCMQFAITKMNIKAGDYSDCRDAKIVVIAAGSNQEVGETRMDLIHKNGKIFKSVIDSVMATGFYGIFVVATNPLDIMTYLTLIYSGLPQNHIIGSGTTLDTARLQYLISSKVHINTDNIEAYVVGEHGDSEFIPWSNASIALKNINEFLTDEEMMQLEKEVRESAYEIIRKKGATAYGIGMCLTKITNAIIEDKNLVLCVSSYDNENKICISTPAIVNKNGVQEKLFIPLNEEETKKMINSIEVIREAIDKL